MGLNPVLVGYALEQIRRTSGLVKEALPESAYRLGLLGSRGDVIAPYDPSPPPKLLSDVTGPPGTHHHGPSSGGPAAPHSPDAGKAGPRNVQSQPPTPRKPRASPTAAAPPVQAPVQVPMLQQLRGWAGKNPGVATAAGLGTAAATAAAAYGASRMMSGRKKKDPAAESVPVKRASVGGLNPVLVEYALRAARAEKRANEIISPALLEASTSLPSVTGALGGGMTAGTIGGLVGAYQAPQGHKIEGLGRGVARGAGAGIGMHLGGSLGAQLGRLPLSPVQRALLAVGGSTVGAAAGGVGGFHLAGRMIGEPSWKKRPAAIQPTGPEKQGAFFAPGGMISRTGTALTNVFSSPRAILSRANKQVMPAFRKAVVESRAAGATPSDVRSAWNSTAAPAVQQFRGQALQDAQNARYYGGTALGTAGALGLAYGGQKLLGSSRPEVPSPQPAEAKAAAAVPPIAPSPAAPVAPPGPPQPSIYSPPRQGLPVHPPLQPGQQPPPLPHTNLPAQPLAQRPPLQAKPAGSK